MATPLNNSVLKAFEILSLFSKARPELTTSTVVEHLGMNTATAHRFLHTLEVAGALRVTKRGYYALGPKIDSLYRVAEENGALAILVQPELERLSHVLNESVMLCRLTRIGAACIAVAASSQAFSVNISVGTILPFHSTAQGKLWLSGMEEPERSSHLESAMVSSRGPGADGLAALTPELTEIQSKGYATNLGENEPEIAAIAVPVRKPDGDMGLSLSCFGLLRRFDDPRVENAVPQLQDGAERIAKCLW